MVEYIILDEFLSEDAKESANTQGLLHKLVRCKDCVHRPIKSDKRHYPIFPDNVCPCQCSDDYYSWYPKDDWFCADGELKDGENNV